MNSMGVSLLLILLDFNHALGLTLSTPSLVIFINSSISRPRYKVWNLVTSSMLLLVVCVGLASSGTNPWSWLFNCVCTKHLVFHIYTRIGITLPLLPQRSLTLSAISQQSRRNTTLLRGREELEWLTKVDAVRILRTRHKDLDYTETKRCLARMLLTSKSFVSL